MAWEALSYVAGAVYDAFVGSAYTATVAEFGAEAAGTAAEVAAAQAAADAAAASALSAGSTASTYATYASVAAQALAGASAYSSATNQQQSATYNAKLGVANAQMASMQAGAAEDAQRRRSALVLGEQRADFAQSGVDPSSGTGLLAQEQSSRNAELDALNIRYQGLLTGRGLLAQSELDSRQATIYGQNADLALVNTPLSILGTAAAARGGYLRRTNYGSTSYGGYGYGGG